MTARISLIPGKARGHRPRLQFLYLSGGKSFSISASLGSACRPGLPVVVKPVHRPKKIMLIHKISDKAAATFPARGAEAFLSQWRTDRPAVNSKTNMLRPDSASNTIFVRKKLLW